MKQKAGRKIVSRGEYAFIRRQEAVRFSLMCCFGAIAAVCVMKETGNGLHHIVNAANYPVNNAVARADERIALQDLLIEILAIVGTIACWRSLKGGFIAAADMDVKDLFIRANTADLPAPDSLVRASQEPLQAQETVLLRAAMETTERQEEELLRASAGGQESSSTWQRFTKRAQLIIFFSQEEAGRRGENSVSTVHLLLALLRDNDSTAAHLLERTSVSRESMRSEIARQETRGKSRVGKNMQLTPRATRVMDLAHDEARQLNNNYVGTEHLLLGLIREGEESAGRVFLLLRMLRKDEGLAGRVLRNAGAELERIREEVRKLQDNDSGTTDQAHSS